MALPPTLDAHGIAVLLLVIIALILFTREEIPLETSSLAVLVLLLLGFHFFPYTAEGETVEPVDFFSGFGHEALVAVSALMIAGQGLVRTGALEPLGRTLAGIWSVSPSLSLLLTLIVSGAFSAFVNNVPIVVLLLPILISIAHRTEREPSGLLMPMGFATLVGGMTTTIGTSTNLLVVSVAADLGLPEFGMFDFFVPAAIAAGGGMLYLWLIAPRLLPKRETPLGDFSPRIFTGHLHVAEDSEVNGKTLAEAMEMAGGAIDIREIKRDGHSVIAPLPDLTLRPGDRIAVRDTPEKLKEYEEVLGATLHGREDTPVDEDHPLVAEDQQVAEIVVTQGSRLDGRTVAGTRFADAQNLLLLALHKAGPVARVAREDIEDERLKVGDVLLVQGPAESIAEIKRKGEVLVLDATLDLARTSRAPIALGIMAGIVGVAALGLAPIAISAVAGVLLMILTRCLNWRDAAQALSAQVILIVVASLALGSALLKTGGADYLAALFLSVSSDLSPMMMLAGLMLVMAILTNIVSNNAAAVIGTPIAITIAEQLGLPPEPFVLAVLFGANMSYATPMAYKTNLLVMNSGGYRFSDFVRVGIPLTAIVWGILSMLLPMLYGL